MVRPKLAIRGTSQRGIRKDGQGQDYDDLQEMEGVKGLDIIDNIIVSDTKIKFKGPKGKATH